VLAVNPAFVELLGYRNEEIVGSSAVDLVVPDQREYVTGKFRAGYELPYRVIGLRKDGSTFHAELRGRTMPYEGRMVRAVAIRDLTESILAEEAFREIESRLMRLVEGMPAAVLLLDDRGRPRYANRNAEELLGRDLKGLGPEASPAQLSGIFHILVAGTDEPYPASRSPLVRALSGEAVTVEDAEIRRPDASVPVELSAAPITDENGEVAYAVVVLKDITERKRAAEALRLAQEKYRDIVENAVAGIFQSTAEGRLLTVNPALARIFGFESAQAMLSEVADIGALYVDPRRRTEWMLMLEDRGVLNGFEAQILRADDERRWIVINARLVRDRDGGLAYYEGTVTDITERRQAVLRMQQSETRYRTLVETSPDAIIVSDLERRIVTANYQSARMLGYESPEELLGEGALDLVAPHQRSDALKTGVRIIREGDSSTMSYDLLRRDGTSFPASIRAAVMRDVDGLVTGMIVVARDISELRHGEEALRRSNDELDGYAQAVSHDLKGPLAGVLLASQTLRLLLEQDTLDLAGVEEVASVIEKNALRATSLVEDLLLLAEAGLEPEQVGEVDVGGIVREVLSERSKEIEERGITVAVDEELGRVKASPTHVYQVFSNLIANSLQHCESCEPRLQISMAAGDGDGKVKYKVCDNGRGIPDDLIGRVFLPFAKGKSGQTGIGLTIVERIAALYGGNVSAYNDCGACFEVEWGSDAVESEDRSATTPVRELQEDSSPGPVNI
jgi:PAS domain S-box-containing protein